MKSIIYLSFMYDLPCKPVLVDHDPRFPAYEHYKHHDPRYTGKLYSWRYVGTVESGMGIHEKINRRAEIIGKTTWFVSHHRVLPPGQYGRKWGRDYQWYVTPERIARSRFRKAKREDRTRRKRGYFSRGYSTIDFSFGLYFGCGQNLNSWEREVIHQRLALASTSRAPLPPWSLNSAVDELLLKKSCLILLSEFRQQPHRNQTPTPHEIRTSKTPHIHCSAAARFPHGFRAAVFPSRTFPKHHENSFHSPQEIRRAIPTRSHRQQPLL